MHRTWDPKYLKNIDWRILPVVLALMAISLLVISSMTAADPDASFWTPFVKSQVRWLFLGWGVFAATAALDYRKLRSLSWPLYGATLLLLIGLYFVPAIQHVHRWYRVGSFNIQPSEIAKLTLAIALAAFLEKGANHGLRAALKAALIVGIPFLLILKQPDLGTALILLPIGLAMGYFAGLHQRAIAIACGAGIALLALVLCLFTGICSHEELRPVFGSFMKEYQYERLNPNTYHQKAAATAIAVGGVAGEGWRQGEFAGRKWLPAAHTDSVFAAYSEEFGFVGVGILLSLFFALIYFSLQTAVVARDPFGRFLAVGLTVYLAMHVLLNIGMMCALLPISGVPLIFVTYGGSSLVATMAALGMNQSIYSRRFMF